MSVTKIVGVVKYFNNNYTYGTIPPKGKKYHKNIYLSDKLWQIIGHFHPTQQLTEKTIDINRYDRKRQEVLDYYFDRTPEIPERYIKFWNSVPESEKVPYGSNHGLSVDVNFNYGSVTITFYGDLADFNTEDKLKQFEEWYANLKYNEVLNNLNLYYDSSAATVVVDGQIKVYE